MNAIFQARLLAAVVAEAQKNISEDPEVGSFYDLGKPHHRRLFGALTSSVAAHFPLRQPSAVRNRLHELKDAGLIEYHRRHGATSIRWFPVSLIPKP